MTSTTIQISHLNHSHTLKEVKTLSFSEEIQKINKVKYNLGVLYFAGVVVLLTTLFI